MSETACRTKVATASHIVASNDESLAHPARKERAVRPPEVCGCSPIQQPIY